MRYFIGAFGLLTIALVALLLHRPEVRVTVPVFSEWDRLQHEAQVEVLAAAETQLGLKLRPFAVHRGDPDPLAEALASAGKSEIGISVPVNGGWVHAKGMGNFVSSTVVFDFTPLSREVGRSEVWHLEFAGRRYKLYSTWGVIDKFYHRFTHLLLREPHTLDEKVEMWAYVGQTSKWISAAGDESWQVDPPAFSDFRGTNIPIRKINGLELTESPMSQRILAVDRLIQALDNGPQETVAWLKQAGFVRHEWGPHTKMPKEFRERADISERHLNREIVRRAQPDATMMHLRYFPGMGDEPSVSIVIESQVPTFRHAYSDRIHLNVDIGFEGRILRAQGYDTQYWVRNGRSYWVVNLGGCKSELARHLRAVIVGLPDEKGSSEVGLAFDVPTKDPFTSPIPWDFGGLVTGGYYDPFTNRRPATFSHCEIH